VEAAMRHIQPLEGTTYEFTGGLNRPPMEPTEGTFRLLEKAQRLAQQLGFGVGSARVGGGSDGNFTSVLAPTLDGFGAMGADAYFLLYDAMKRAQSVDGPKVREALATTKDFEGVTGKISIGDDGNAVKSVVINQVKDGKFVYVQSISP